MVWEWPSNLLRGVLDEATDDVMYKMMKDKYTDNMLGTLSILKRMSFFNAEVWMRATQGEALERPLGTHLRFSPWELLLLNPVHLHRFPVEDTTPIETSVTIGPAAPKPMHLRIPVFITGMSFGGALSKAVKVALARAASLMGTATNTGESGLVPDEREAAKILIGQYNRGGYLNSGDKYKQLDAIEIQLGQGAQGASPQKTQAKFVDGEMQEVFGLKPGQDIVLHTRIPGVNTAEDFRALVRRLRDETGVPVGVKIAASHFLEKELAIILESGADFVTVDGAEGATHAAAPTLEDDLGLPSIYAIARARRFLDSRGFGKGGRISLLAGGGLFTPGQFMKALALGADAVYIGTAAIMAVVAQQATKAIPTESVTPLVLQTGRLKDKFEIETGTRSLVNFLQLSVAEMTSTMYALGKSATDQLDSGDLVCLDPWLARAVGVDFAGVSTEEQASYYGELGNTQWWDGGRLERQPRHGPEAPGEVPGERGEAPLQH